MKKFLGILRVSAIVAMTTLCYACTDKDDSEKGHKYPWEQKENEGIRDDNQNPNKDKE